MYSGSTVALVYMFLNVHYYYIYSMHALIYFLVILRSGTPLRHPPIGVSVKHRILNLAPLIQGVKSHECVRLHVLRYS